jgi:hypothetical protein
LLPQEVRVNCGASGSGAERLLTLLNKLGVSVSIAFHEEPDLAPGETTFVWDRERDSDVAPDEEPSEEAGLRFRKGNVLSGAAKPTTVLSLRMPILGNMSNADR